MKRITEFICRHFHGRPYRPVNGVYRCRKCLRTWPVPWSGDTKPKPDAPDSRRGELLEA